MTTQTQGLEEEVRRLELEKRKRQLQRELGREDAVRSAVQQTTATGARVAQAAVEPSKKVLGYVLRVVALVLAWAALCAYVAFKTAAPGAVFAYEWMYCVGWSSWGAVPLVLLLAVWPKALKPVLQLSVTFLAMTSFMRWR